MGAVLTGAYACRADVMTLCVLSATMRATGSIAFRASELDLVGIELAAMGALFLAAQPPRDTNLRPGFA
jgi:hypothetical protein